MPAGAARRAPPPAAPAVAARARQLSAQAEHRRAVAEFRARRAADQQARINALLLEAIAALAGLADAQQLVTPQPPPVPREPIRTAPQGFCPPPGEPRSWPARWPAFELGAWDRRTLRWLAGQDTSTVLTIASWITRTRATTPSRQPQP